MSAENQNRTARIRTREPGGVWERGWFVQENAFSCTGHDHAIDRCEPFYCTGKAGEVFCAEHAHEHGAPRLPRVEDKCNGCGRFMSAEDVEKYESRCSECA